MNYVQEYTIIHNGTVFTTEWFTPANDFVPGMIVINNQTQQYSPDGWAWFDIEADEL